MTRVISLVPSWTETLLTCGVEVIGRTRYCIHPAPRVGAIPALGGTKQLDWSRWRHLAADLVVMDQEENTRTMAAECPFPVLASQVRSPADAATACAALGRRLNNDKLRALGERWQRIATTHPAPRTWDHLPGVIEWWRRPEVAPRQMIYLIWRKPWMGIGPDTFIGSVLTRLGFGWALPRHDTPYPTIELPTASDPPPLLLLATEPYPFARHRDALLELPYPMALVDGEAYSWFGVRALEFLERHLVE